MALFVDFLYGFNSSCNAHKSMVCLAHKKTLLDARIWLKVGKLDYSHFSVGLELMLVFAGNFTEDHWLGHLK